MSSGAAPTRRRHLRPRLLHRRVGLLAEGVLPAGGVAEALGEVRQHGRQHGRVDGRGRVVVEVDAGGHAARHSS